MAYELSPEYGGYRYNTIEDWLESIERRLALIGLNEYNRGARLDGYGGIITQDQIYFFDPSDKRKYVKITYQGIDVTNGTITLAHPLGPAIILNPSGIDFRDATNFPIFRVGTYVDNSGTPISYVHIGPWDGGVHVTYDPETGKYTTDIPGQLVTGTLTGISIDTEKYVKVGVGEEIVQLSGEDATYRIWVGASDPALAKFRVHKQGYLYAEEATIQGNITAQTLSIQEGDIKDVLRIGAGGKLRSVTAYYPGSPSGSGFWFGEYGGNYVAWVGNADTNRFWWWDGTNFEVRGKIYGYEGELWNLAIKDVLELVDDSSRILIGATKAEVNAGTAKSYIEISNGAIISYDANGNPQVYWVLSDGSIRSADETVIIDRYGFKPTEIFLQYRFVDLSGKFVPDLSRWGNNGELKQPYEWAPKSVILRRYGDDNAGRLLIRKNDADTLAFSKGDWLGIQITWWPSRKEFVIFYNGKSFVVRTQGYAPSIESNYDVNLGVYIDSSGYLVIEYTEQGTPQTWHRWKSTNVIVTDATLQQWHTLSITMRMGYGNTVSVYHWTEGGTQATVETGSWVSGDGNSAPNNPGINEPVYVGSNEADVEYYVNGEKIGEQRELLYEGAGRIQQLRVWRRELTTQEMQNYYGVG